MLMLRNMEGNNVTPITLGSNNVEWFFCRKFSFTSYPTDRVIKNILKVSKTVRDIIEVEDDDVKTYREYLGRNNNITNEYDNLT